MKKTLSKYILILSVIFFSACEKVIDVDLDSTSKKYVIEGIITDNAGGSSIKITQTKDFNENNNFVGVSGANVTVTDNGALIQLQESETGVYSSTALLGVQRHSYTMQVKIGDETFTATSTMPAKINMDTLYVKEEEFFGTNKKIPNVSYIDPAGKGNNYRFVLYRNHKMEKPIYVVNDDYAEDKTANWQLLNYEEEEDEDKVKTGDVITVDMFCIDKSVYKYWLSISAASGGGSGSTPANPVTNISGGALGYFSAHTAQRKEVVVD